MAAGFLGSVATSLLNNALSQKNAQDQRDWQERMFHLSNHYNSPVSQMLMRKAAGANPYENLNQANAASFGTGATADTLPISDPLMSLKTLAEIENISSSTTKTDAETENLYKQLDILDLEYSRGVLSYEEYKRRLELLFEEWNKANPYTVEREKIQSEISKNLSEVEKNQAEVDVKSSQASLNKAIQDTEDALRDLKVATEKSQKAYYDAMADSAFASASKALAEGRAVTQEADRKAYILGVGDFFGIDLLSLPPGAQNSILEIYRRGENYWKSLGKSDNSAEHYNSAITEIRQILERYMNSESAVLESEKSGYKLKFFGVGAENSSGSTKNTNR